ncbi:MAG: Zn-dependent protease/CBS domain-containing protein [Myxococcota bacterium]|jgi:Zn-dependent protease/CBS domain-containing protein
MALERWSRVLGTLAGIQIRVHATFLLLVPWIIWRALSVGGGVVEVLEGLLLVAVLFFIVVLHELGHSLMARRFGIETRDIILLPIGGVARLESMPSKPWPQLLIAVAGPAVNAVLAVVLFGAALVVHGRSGLHPASVQMGLILPTLAWINVVLCLFNLLPAFPMDGGRVLRAVLAFFTRDESATRIAGRIGQGIGFGFVVLGLMANPMLTLIGVFVMFGAGAEIKNARIGALLEGITVSDAMATDVRMVTGDTPLEHAFEILAHGFQSDMPVVGGDGEYLGMVTHSDLVQAIATRGGHVPIAAIVRPPGGSAAPGEPLAEVLSRVSSGAPAVPVLVDGQLCGLLTARKATQMLALAQAGVHLPHHGNLVSSDHDTPRHDAEREVRQAGSR